jgi:hypothetical protein
MVAPAVGANSIAADANAQIVAIIIFELLGNGGRTVAERYISAAAERARRPAERTRHDGCHPSASTSSPSMSTTMSAT